MIKKAIKAVGLFGKYQDPAVGGHVARLADYLRARKLQVIVEDATAAVVPTGDLPHRSVAELCPIIDLAVVVGGDGTLLNAARSLAPCRVPIIGVNLGRLGFLTDIAADTMLEEIGQILDGDHQIEQRLLLSAEIMRKGKIVHSATAFNDVIVTKRDIARLIEFEIYLGGEFVIDSRADGLIVASPTGSTAYAMSAGGPILHPGLPAIALVPICPHTLSFRPIVVSSDSTVEIVMVERTPHAHVTFDGQLDFPLEPGDRIYVRRADTPVELIHPSRRSHFEVLRAKLFWGK
ncbi:MAG: NAD(+) kinase [Pseudomonadota bacterium]|nr:MAG: NAD(+) kinase [Pseudomonadota bacterium]